MKVKFFKQHFYNRTEIFIFPAVGIIVRKDGWSVAICWILWSVSFIFNRRATDG